MKVIIQSTIFLFLTIPALMFYEQSGVSKDLFNLVVIEWFSFLVALLYTVTLSNDWKNKEEGIHLDSSFAGRLLVFISLYAVCMILAYFIFFKSTGVSIYIIGLFFVSSLDKSYDIFYNKRFGTYISKFLLFMIVITLFAEHIGSTTFWTLYYSTSALLIPLFIIKSKAVLNMIKVKR